MMAEVTHGISIAVERAVHDTLAAALNAISAEYGIVVLDVNTTWTNSRLGERPRIFRLTIRTETEHAP